MKKVLFILTLIVFSVNLNIIAQISQGGTPPSFIHTSITSECDFIQLQKPNMEIILKEDDFDEKNGTLKMNARLLPVSLNMENSGDWTDLPDGGKIWRLKITSNGALALGVYYNDFYIPTNGKLYLYNGDKKQVIGAYTEINNPICGLFATELIQGDNVTLEYYQPAAQHGNPIISIENIAYVYRDVQFWFEKSTTGFGDSDYCQVNVNCSPEGDDWQDEKRGVARIYVIMSQGAGWCSGSLINNVRQDCTPYMLSADHCSEGSTASHFNQYVFYFNYEAAGCSNPGSPPSSGTVTGCSKVSAANAASASDFLLLELNSAIPSSYNAYFNGWDRRNITSTSGVAIHHPAGDIKKISTHNNSTASASWGGSVYSHWRVYWSATSNGHGVTEGGSSGSSLFNSEGRIIGDLTGGASYCNNTNGQDLFGKVSYSWDSYGSSASTHLKEWLDPDDTGIETLNGKENACAELAPIVNFTGEDTIVYSGQGLDFIDLSAENPHHWIWYFEGANIDSSLQQNPYNVVYDSIGYFDVMLVAWNAYGYDTLVLTDYVHVIAVPADLDIVSNTVSTTVVVSGEVITTNSNVKNLGQSTSTENYLKIYLSNNILLDINDIFLDSVLVDSINHLQQITVTKDIIMPAGTATGVKYLLFKVDANNDIYESNENNNSSYKAITIVAELPDMHVDDAQVDSSTIHAGESTDASCTVSSIGYLDSPSSNVKVYLSENSSFDISTDILIHTENFAGIVTGNNESLSFNITIPHETDFGSYYLLYIVDEVNAIQETSENNNVDIIPISVLNPIGISELNLNSNVQIIPNPNRGEFDIIINSNKFKTEEISVFNIIGNLITSKSVENSSDIINVDLKYLPSGVYFLRIMGETQIVTKRFVVE